jgi:hypothetical protein
VWWLRLGIHFERIQPGHPEQNGRHERMHLTLKTEATKPAMANVLQQQARFDTVVERFNRERPHQALRSRYVIFVQVPTWRASVNRDGSEKQTCLSAKDAEALGAEMLRTLGRLFPRRSQSAVERQANPEDLAPSWTDRAATFRAISVVRR